MSEHNVPVVTNLIIHLWLRIKNGGVGVAEACDIGKGGSGGCFVN